MVRASLAVTNTGQRPGAEVVQMYAASPPAPQRPEQRLVGFRKVSLQPGQTSTVEFAVPVRDLAFFDQTRGRYRVDTGRYEFRVGSSSRAIAQRAAVTVTGELPEVPAVLSAKPAGLIYSTHSTIRPVVIVAMSDDVLYGPGRPFPAGLVVRLTSNRPSVVAVDPDGTIRTVAPGVATVTVTATYHGTSISTRFVALVR
jgi:beta-glucosidase